MTVHKVQDLSLDEGVVSFELKSQKSFIREQMYVTLSRISSTNKTYLIRKYRKAALKLHVSTKKEYKRLGTKIQFKSRPEIGVIKSNITISLLKTHSLKNILWILQWI